jgi:hypothetical protein
MTDNTPENRLDEALQNLETTLAEAEADHSEDMRVRSVNLRQRIRNFLGGGRERPEDREGLRAELLEWETQLIETRPRLANALRSAVAIIDNAGL